jgi:flagellar hook-associated protein 3 FlgL
MTFSVGRVSTMQFSQFNRQFVSRATTELQRAGQEVATGRKADIFADLGPRAASTLTLRAREEDTQAYKKANGILENKLQAMLTSLEAVRESVDSVFQSALINVARPVNGASALQGQARASLEVVIATMNISFDGDALFSGTASDRPPLTRWSEVNPDTGLSPEAVLQSIVTSPPTTAAEAQTMIDDINAVFDSAYATDPNANFEATFYNGTPELDGSGQPENRVSARIEAGLALDYGVQANDQPFRDMLKGLAMLAVTDVSKITDEAAYSTWMAEATETLNLGSQGALESSATTGFNQQVVSTAQKRLDALSLVQRMQISNYESVDPYEAVNRMTNLETQLQASYQVTARLGGLSILNFL